MIYKWYIYIHNKEIKNSCEVIIFFDLFINLTKISFEIKTYFSETLFAENLKITVNYK